MQLTLADSDAQTLQDIPHDYLPNLCREAARTNLSARELRHELVTREVLCERLLAELGQAAPPGTAEPS